MGLPVPRVWRMIIHHSATMATMGSSTGSQVVPWADTEGRALAAVTTSGSRR